MTFFLSLGAAFLFGAGDFVGGIASRRAQPLQVAAISQWTGLLILVPAFALFGDRPSAASLVWGAAAGLSTGVGLVFIFRALSAALMAIGAAVAGIFTAVLPVIFGLVTGERPSPLAAIGLTLAILAIGPIVADPETTRELQWGRARRPSLRDLRRLGVIDGAIAGIGWAGTSILWAQTPIEGGLWPLVSAQTATVVVLTGIVLASGRRMPAFRPAALQAGSVGVLHVSGGVMFLVALQRGLLTLVAVVQSLYPAVTILLARFVVKERLARRQVVGLMAAAFGVTFIGIG
jgi:drug/metabolite transporter (DMT)-like permease